MGLDRDDTVIRRRLRQKMEFIFEQVFLSSERCAAVRAALEVRRARRAP